MTTSVIKKADFDEQSLARKCIWLILAMVMFVVFFYSGTVLMSIVFPLDEALLGF
jgi:hypothetical protein